VDLAQGQIGKRFYL